MRALGVLSNSVGVFSINGNINIVQRTSIKLAEGYLKLFSIEIPGGFILNDILIPQRDLSPSHLRTSEFLKTRFSLEKAIALADQYARGQR